MRGEGKGLGERQAPALKRPGVLQALDAPTPPARGEWAPARDFAVAGASHPLQHIHLSPEVLHVKTGTPVRPTPSGWVVCPANIRPLAFAGNHHTAGEEFVAYRAITVESYQRKWLPGDRIHITAVDDYGNILLERHPDGPYTAVSETQVLLTVDGWREPIPVPVLEAAVVEPAVPADFTTQVERFEEVHAPGDSYTTPEYGDEEVLEVRQESQGELQVNARKRNKKLGQVPRAPRTRLHKGRGGEDHQRHEQEGQEG